MIIHKLSRVVVWVCRKFTRSEIENIIAELHQVLEDPGSEVQPRDEFKEEHPNYRRFDVDPLEPLSEPPVSKKNRKLPDNP